MHTGVRKCMYIFVSPWGGAGGGVRGGVQDCVHTGVRLWGVHAGMKVCVQM